MRGVTGSHVACERGRNFQSDVSAALAHFPFHRFLALHLPHYAKSFCVYEMIDQLAALDGAIFIQNNHGHMFHVIVEGVAEGNHFDQRGKKHEEKRHRIAPDDDEFLEENGSESAKRFAFHHAAFRCSPACCAESSTKTSSSEGPIS